MTDLPLPLCGTCPHTVPIAGGGAGTYWCHGGPPSSNVRGISDLGPDGKPLPPETKWVSDWPPVADTMVGCATHPDWPLPKRHGWRRLWWWALFAGLTLVLIALSVIATVGGRLS